MGERRTRGRGSVTTTQQHDDDDIDDDDDNDDADDADDDNDGDDDDDDDEGRRDALSRSSEIVALPYLRASCRRYLFRRAAKQLGGPANR